MPKQEWEKATTEELEKNIAVYIKYLLDNALMTGKKILDLKETEKIWRHECSLSLRQASKTWDKAWLSIWGKVTD